MWRKDVTLISFYERRALSWEGKAHTLSKTFGQERGPAGPLWPFPHILHCPIIKSTQDPSSFPSLDLSNATKLWWQFHTSPDNLENLSRLSSETAGKDICEKPVNCIL